MKKIKIIERKLGREQADGLAHQDTNLIEIDTKLSPKEHLATSIHEALHIAFKDMTEKEVMHGEKVVTDVLWRLNYRRVKQ